MQPLSQASIARKELAGSRIHVRLARCGSTILCKCNISKTHNESSVFQGKSIGKIVSHHAGNFRIPLLQCHREETSLPYDSTVASAATVRDRHRSCCSLCDFNTRSASTKRFNFLSESSNGCQSFLIFPSLFSGLWHSSGDLDFKLAAYRCEDVGACLVPDYLGTSMFVKFKMDPLIKPSF